MRTNQGLSGESMTNKNISSAMSSALKVSSNASLEPEAEWRDQVKMVKEAFYNPNFQSTDGKKDPCKFEFCFARANTIAALVAKSGSAEVLGWIEGTIKDGGEVAIAEGVSWDFHIATVIRDQGKVYIADPLSDVDIPLESRDDVTAWVDLTMADSLSDKMEYIFIPPTDGNYAGMNTTEFPANTIEDIASEINSYKGEVLQADFVETPAFTLGFMNMTKYRSAVVDQNLGVHEAKAVVENNPMPVDNNFLWKKPFSLILPEKNDSRTSAVEHTPELKAVMRGLGLPFSERLEI